MNTLIPTGNEFISLPTIRTNDAAVESLNVILMQLDGLLEFCGPSGAPFLSYEGAERESGQWNWKSREYWIPEFTHQADSKKSGVIFAPPGERFMVYQAPRAAGAQSFTLSIGDIFQTANIRHKLPGVTLVASEFNWGYKPGFVINVFADTLIASIAIRCTGPARFESEGGGAEPLKVRIHCDDEPTLMVGVGLSSVGAFSATLEAHRVAPSAWLARSEAWLAKRKVSIPKDRDLETKANRNGHFARFFAMGRALDTGEVVSMTSRSHRYYVSSAYWDRDSLLWLFPFLVRNDPEHAQQLLQYAFGRQLRDAGIHSRYISGRILEYGFELDELLAPLAALGTWNKLHPGDRFWESDTFRAGIDSIMTRFRQRRHPKVALYSTELMPTDDLVLENRSYLTYNNALAIHALTLCLPVFKRIAPKWAPFAMKEIAAIRAAVKKHLVKNGMYLWSTDLAGNTEFYDEAAGSLTLLPYLGFCKATDPAYRKTLKHLYSPNYPYYRQGPFAELGNRHTDSPHPWVLSACSSVLSGVRRKEGLDFLRRAAMDDGIACESVDINTGVPTSGYHFATCAGYVAYAIMAGAGRK
jgi:TPR repeat protein